MSTKTLKTRLRALGVLGGENPYRALLRSDNLPAPATQSMPEANSAGVLK